MIRRRIRLAVFALAGLGLIVGLAQPVTSRADDLPPLPTPTTRPKTGGPGGGGG